MIGIPSRIFGWFSKFGQFFASHPNNAKIHSKDGCKSGTFSAILPEIDRKNKKMPFLRHGRFDLMNIDTFLWLPDF
jgi:hypothetical protein